MKFKATLTETLTFTLEADSEEQAMMWLYTKTINELKPRLKNETFKIDYNEGLESTSQNNPISIDISSESEENKYWICSAVVDDKYGEYLLCKASTKEDARSIINLELSTIGDLWEYEIYKINTEPNTDISDFNKYFDALGKGKEVVYLEDEEYNFILENIATI